MRVIFLDIDGVLNSEEYYTVHSEDIILNPIDTECVGRLKQIVDATGAKIVLTSSWRGGWSKEPGEIDEMCRVLVEVLAACDLEIYDKTCVLDKMGARGEEIRCWLKNAPEKVESFVIIDDNDFQWKKHKLWKRWVPTDFSEGGLQDRHVEKEIKILNARRWGFCSGCRF